MEERIYGTTGAVVVLLNTHSHQHLLETRPSHRSLATSQTSELVGKAPKTCNSYPDAIFK